MLIPRRIPIVLALVAGGVALMALTLTAAAAPNTPIQYPSGTCPTTLQACINAANPGDEIRIAPGDYITSFTLNKAVSLVHDDTLGPAPVTIHASPGQRVITVTGAITPSTRIDNIGFSDGVLATGNGGGMLVVAPAQPTLIRVAFQDNVISGTNALGAGLFTQTSLTISNSVFADNTAVAGSGGGLAGAPGVALTLSVASFFNNFADDSGGGLFAERVRIESSIFLGNEAADGEGGGAYLTATATIIGVTLNGNEAEGHGGGLYAGGDVVLTSSTFQTNLSHQGSGAGAYIAGGLLAHLPLVDHNTSFDSGGGLYVGGPLTQTGGVYSRNNSTGGSGAGLRAASTVILSGTQFMSNTAYNPGGGMRVNLHAILTNTTFISNTSGGSGGGLRTNATASLSGGSFVANTSADGGGGALFASDAVVAETRFDGNTVLVGDGGGLAALGPLTLTDSLFTANRVLSGTSGNGDGRGGGVFVDGPLASSGNRFVGNFAFRLGGGADMDDGTSTGDEFRGNVTGPQGSGGGLFVAGVFAINASEFYTNTGNTGGGLGVNSTAAGTLQNSLFARNTVTFTDGGAAMRLLSTTSAVIAHNTLVGANQPSVALVHIQGSGAFTFTNNIFADSSIGIKNFGPLTVTEDYNLFFNVPIARIGPVSVGANSFTANPLFSNPGADDYHLLVGSPAIDAGLFQGVSADFEGDPRNLFGGGYDLGFDEFLARMYLPVVVR